MIRKIKNFIYKNEKYLSPLALLGGFLIDNFTLRRIDLWAENILIIIYLSIAVFSIVILNFSHAGFLKHRIFKKTDSVFSLLLQFVFGGLFSVFFIFYFRSASFVSSWVFLLIIFSLLVGNEIFRDSYKKFSFQISIFFVSLFSYLVFLVPLVTKQINKINFFYSGALSIIIISILLYLLYIFFPKRFSLNKKVVFINIFSIYFLFNFLYFINIIPPIPLALKESELVHQLNRVDGGYEVSFEKASILSLAKTSKNFSWVEGESVYLFTSVFSPTEINVKIFHDWYFFNDKTNKWTLKSSLNFPVFGGRDNGYRGYSYKQSIQPGKWKIKITNELGQILGVKKFNVIGVDNTPVLTSDIW